MELEARNLPRVVACILIVLIIVENPLARFVRQDDATGELFYEISEELPSQTVVADIFADSRLSEVAAVIDERGKPSDSLQFEILFGTFRNLFSVESPLGLLRVNETIDRDVICFKKTRCNLNLDVQVTGSNQFLQLFRIVISILDINDNAPTFSPSRLVVNISESTPQGTRIILPTIVEDQDSDQLGSLSYDYSTNCSKIELSVSNSGVPAAAGDLYLVVIDKLDREESDVCVMQMVAFDNGNPSKSGFLEVFVFVEDANDNMPRFEKDVYNVSVREDFPLDRPLLRVHADDEDDGLNGRVTYGLPRRSTSTVDGAVFYIDGVTGDIYLRQMLDYHKEEEYILAVTATDSGPSAIPTYAQVVITVIDVNDNAPTIRVKSHLQVPEGQPRGTLVGHVSVDDIDSGPNGEVQCAVSDPELFVLEKLYPKVYKILTNDVFDREARQDHSLKIICRDGGEPSLETTENVVVRIADVNDNDPVFVQEAYSVNVRENSSFNVPIMRIIARDSDADENAAIEYSLSNSSFGLLVVDRSTGIVSTVAAFDYEEQIRYVFQAIAVDGGQPPRSATTTIVLNVIDFNDEAPIFQQASYTFGTFENQPPGTEIGMVSATDRDTPPYDKFTFSIARSKPVLNTFRIDGSSGKITASRVLDREQYSVHYLTIVATNVAYPNPSSFVNVTVYVADRNDNAPMIEFPTGENYTVEVAPDAPVGTRISRVIARDADIGNNARLEYSIAKGNNGDFFDIDPSDGTLSLKRSLLLLSTAVRYNLVLVVKDCGDQEKSASALLDVFVNKSSAAVAASTKNSAVQTSRLFDVTVDTLFSYEVIIVLLCVMAALIVVLVVTIVYVKRCRVVPSSSSQGRASSSGKDKKQPQSTTDELEFIAAKVDDRDHDEYTYRTADSVDVKDDIRNMLNFNSHRYNYPEDSTEIDRTPTHYTFAKTSHEAEPTNSQSLVLRPLLSMDGHNQNSNLTPTSVSNCRTMDTGDVEFRRLLDILRRADDKNGSHSHYNSTQSNLDSGRGPSETDIDNFSTQPATQPTPSVM